LGSLAAQVAVVRPVVEPSRERPLLEVMATAEGRMAAVVQGVLLMVMPEARLTKAPHLATCMVKAAA